MSRRRGDTVARVGVGVVAAIALVALAGGSGDATPASSPAPPPPPPPPPRAAPPAAPAGDPLGDLARGVPSGSVPAPAAPATSTPAGSVPAPATPATSTPAGSVPTPTTTTPNTTTTTPATPTGERAAAEELRRLIEANTITDRARISDLQRALGIRIDGIVGKESVGAVARQVQRTDAGRAAREWLLYMDHVVPTRRISPDRTYLRELQRRLGGGIPVDGIDGPRTRARMGEALRQDV